ncbi:hypothetical protein WR25_01597 [Diploscapter pachys]|uniref:Uncharacterized protein n=1 Tax=Diploscapter pachys TaxID=2018661 RepID=A0A2A2M3I2_9BILA|nr:hypothetical protein WR25_01597 [Diploscapter pachys]
MLLEQVGAIPQADQDQDGERDADAQHGDAARGHACRIGGFIGHIFGLARPHPVEFATQVGGQLHLVHAHRAGIGLGEAHRIGRRGQGTIIARFQRLQMALRHAGACGDLRQAQAPAVPRGTQPIARPGRFDGGGGRLAGFDLVHSYLRGRGVCGSLTGGTFPDGLLQVNAPGTLFGEVSGHVDALRGCPIT